MSLIGTPQTSGAKRIASTMAVRIAPLATARRWRRNRLQASSQGEKRRAARSGGARASAESDARIEPAIKDICDQVEEDDETGEHEGHRHDDRRVVGEDRADQQGSDA